MRVGRAVRGHSLNRDQSFQVKATDIRADHWPILRTVLRELGDAKITINTAAEFRRLFAVCIPITAG